MCHNTSRRSSRLSASAAAFALCGADAWPDRINGVFIRSAIVGGLDVAPTPPSGFAPQCSNATTISHAWGRS
jgi:hypothetical protein